MVHAQVQDQGQKADFVIGLITVFNAEQFSSSTMGDFALQSEIIELFFAQLSAAQQSLNSRQFSREELKFLGHTLHGAAVSIGAVEIAAIAASWEETNSRQGELCKHLLLAEERFKVAIDSFFQLS